MNSRRRRLALLGLLYVVQGMPFGFQSMALPIYLAEAKVSLTTVGFAGLLALPWALKALWAPFVERTGLRRPWLLAMSGALLLLCAVAAVSPPDESLTRLAIIILLMNFVTATQDIAVDGIAVDLLPARELGTGNAAQVAGYKTGMVIAGGVIVAASDSIPWALGFALIGAIVAFSIIVLFQWEEPPPHAEAAAARASVREILRALARTVRLPGQLWVLAVVSTYKLGESISDAMWKQYVLREAHHPKAAVGLWMNVWGMAPSIVGSLAGGLLATRATAHVAIASAATLRAVAVSLYATIALTQTTDFELLVAASWFEELTGGALTTAMFAFMMSQVDGRIGATHYTVLASLEVIGKTPGGPVAGVIAQHAGFAVCFAIAAILSVAYLPLLYGQYRASVATPRRPITMR